MVGRILLENNHELVVLTILQFYGDRLVLALHQKSVMLSAAFERPNPPLGSADDGRLSSAGSSTLLSYLTSFILAEVYSEMGVNGSISNGLVFIRRA